MKGMNMGMGSVKKPAAPKPIKPTKKPKRF
jgi:hypothetical protein